jgi:O-antigen ligase
MSIINHKSTFINAVNKDGRGIPKNQAIFPFYLIIIYLFFEYGRPQMLLPVLGFFHLPLITVVLLAMSLFITGKLYLKDNQTIVFIFLLFEMVIHGPIAVNNYWAFQVFYSMIATFFAYLAIVNIIDSEYKYHKLIEFWLLIFIFLAVFGYFNANLNIAKRYRTGIGVGGFVGDANDFSMALNMILPFALFGIFTAKKIIGKIYFLILICLFVFVIIISESRGGFIGLAAVLIYSWVRSNKKIILALLLLILVIFALIAAPTTYWDEVKSITTENTEDNQYGTGAQRIYAWKIGWRIFLDHPIIGVGQGNYPWRVAETEDKMGVQWQKRSLAGRAAHSLYFTLLPELGIVGTILFICLIVFSLKDLWYVKKMVKAKNRIYSEDESIIIYYLVLALEGSLIGFLTSSTFISTLYYPSFWIWCGFSLSLKKIIYSKVKIFNVNKSGIVSP